MVGELDAGNPHVQFDEGAQETCDSATRLCPTLRGAPWLLLVDPMAVLHTHIAALDREIAATRRSTPSCRSWLPCREPAR